MITLAVILCRIAIGIPICHEEIIARGRMSLIACQMNNQPAVSEWKETSKFKGKHWSIDKIYCGPGNYEKKDAI